MKKNYIYLIILILCTIFLTLFLSSLYRKETVQVSYAYENLNKITKTEFEEYLLENPDAIIYIGDKTNIKNNKIEKKIINKIIKLNLLEKAIYIEREDIVNSFEKILKEKYNYTYEEKNFPIMLLIVDGELSQKTLINKQTNINNVIDYGVFE